ncbi:MAG: Gfo/Idh/MocA family oxidoreductase [Lentisphaerae bacterium]|nr:Gfo/Idh/MocA family oxidoreductase [Lentisphaerota bacterium]
MHHNHTPEKLKLCIIGSRGHTGYVFNSLAGMPEVELTAVSGGGDDPGKLVELAGQNGFAPAVYDQWQQMLDEIKPDLLAVAGPFELHAAMTVYALRRNIHVFCEKPVALTMSDWEKVRDTAAGSTALLMSMTGLRYAAPFQHALHLVRSGAVGKIKLIRAQKSYKLGERPGYYRCHASYGGTIPWVGSHAFDWVIAFSGSSIDRIWATQSRTDNRNHGDLEIACHCMMTTANGIQAALSLDYLRPGAAPTHGDDRVRIAGTEGILEVMDGKIILLDGSGRREIAVPPAEREIFVDFVRAATGKCVPLVSVAETLELTRACLLARDNAITI